RRAPAGPRHRRRPEPQLDPSFPHAPGDPGPARHGRRPGLPSSATARPGSGAITATLWTRYFGIRSVFRGPEAPTASVEASALTHSGVHGHVRGPTPLLRIQSDERLVALTRRGN